MKVEDNEEIYNSRKFNLNQPHQQYGNNQIESTNYTLLTFVPLNILHQMRSLANIYFVFICIMQTLPAISVTGGKPTTIIPLFFVIFTVLIKDAYEELSRYQKDKQQNSRPTQVLTNQGFIEVNWSEIYTGQVIKILQDQLIPCDCLVIKTSLQDNKCFIETKNLDGETNLKLRKSPIQKNIFDNMSNEEMYQKNYEISMENPHQFLNRVNGSITINKQKIPISIQNVLIRGCYLRNCSQAICVSLYVGSDTKVILNSTKFKPKRSMLMQDIDRMIFGIFIWQSLISLVLGIFNTLFENGYDAIMNYIPASKFWMMTPSWWLMMTYFIPISLIVTMELIKLCEGMVINNDIRGYSKQYQCMISANNTSVNENLGQVKYVFTDKTGTLTKNQMNFKNIIVDGKSYGDIDDISTADMHKNYPIVKSVDFRDSSFLKSLYNERVQSALRVLYLCHQILTMTQEDGSIDYNSSSPDQIALVNFAKLCGKELIHEEDQHIRVFDHQSKNTLKYRKMAFLEFNSDRKRMSVIVQLPNGQIQILTKGADSSIQKLLAPKQPKLLVTKQHLQDYSIKGLRTLLLARRIIPKQQFQPWFSKYKQAKSSIHNREQNLSRIYEQIEKDLQLIGGTAVEDKLQDDVAKTITTMKEAGMKFFILTGDKKQTAVNIGRSCGLIQNNARVISYPEEFTEEAHQYRGQKIYLINGSGELPQLPDDMLHHQTIFYRCTPSQKENIVRYVKKKVNQLTLAIGDGANDVNMILAADIGIGVKGKQGTEAVRVADFAIGQFKFLSFLTLYYGREWYKKNAQMVSYYFFKNWYHVASVIFYGSYSFYSGFMIYDIYSHQMYNTFYTTLPIIFFAVFDEQFTEQQSMTYPGFLYEVGRNKKYFNQIVYFKHIGLGLIYGFLSIVTIFMVMEDGIISSNGNTGYLNQSGAVLFFNIILVSNLRVLVIGSGVSIAMIISIMIGCGMYWIVYYVQVFFLQDFMLVDSFYQEWTNLSIFLLHLAVALCLLGGQLILTRYQRLKDKESMIKSGEFSKITLFSKKNQGKSKQSHIE